MEKELVVYAFGTLALYTLYVFWLWLKLAVSHVLCDFSPHTLTHTCCLYA